jgi:hypothetical protein
MWMVASIRWPWVISNPNVYRFESCYQARLPHECRSRACREASEAYLENNFQIDIFWSAKEPASPNSGKHMIQLLAESALAN